MDAEKDKWENVEDERSRASMKTVLTINGAEIKITQTGNKIK